MLLGAACARAWPVPCSRKLSCSRSGSTASASLPDLMHPLPSPPWPGAAAGGQAPHLPSPWRTAHASLQLCLAQRFPRSSSPAGAPAQPGHPVRFPVTGKSPVALGHHWSLLSRDLAGPSVPCASSRGTAGVCHPREQRPPWEVRQAGNGLSWATASPSTPQRARQPAAEPPDLHAPPGTVLTATGSESQGSEHRTGLQGADSHPKTPLLLSSIRSLSESSRCRSRASSECVPASRRAQGMSAGVAERSPNQEWPSAWKRGSLVKETSPETSASHAKTIELFQDPRSHLQTL